MFIIIDCYLVLHHKYEIYVTLCYVIASVFVLQKPVMMLNELSMWLSMVHGSSSVLSLVGQIICQDH